MLKPNRVSIVLAAAALIIVPTLLTAPASAQTKVYVVGDRDPNFDRDGRSYPEKSETLEIGIIIGTATVETILEKSETLETGIIGTVTADPTLEKSETQEIGTIGTVTTNPITE